MKRIFLSCIFIFCAIEVFAETVISKNSEILLDGKVVGRAEVLTPVTVLEQKDENMDQITIKGVVSENYLGQIKKSMKNGEVYVTFDNEDESNFKKLNTLEDDYGEIWYEVEGIYQVGKDSITKDSEALYDRAKKIYEESCSICHRLHEPNSFTANQWPANMQSMVDLNYVAIEKDDIDLITKYLQHNAKESE